MKRGEKGESLLGLQSQYKSSVQYPVFQPDVFASTASHAYHIPRRHLFRSETQQTPNGEDHRCIASRCVDLDIGHQNGWRGPTTFFWRWLRTCKAGQGRAAGARDSGASRSVRSEANQPVDQSEGLYP